jgi:hypothetical protein
MIAGEFSDPVYCRPYWFLISTPDELDTWIQKEFPGAKRPAMIGDNDVNAAAFSVVHDTQGLRYDMIWMRWFDGSIASYGRLVHECAHAVISVFAYISHPIEKDTDEAFCYYLEYVVEQCARIARGKSNGPKRKHQRTDTRRRKGNSSSRKGTPYVSR